MKKNNIILLFLSLISVSTISISKTDENPDIDSDLYPYRYNNWSCPMCGWHWRNRGWNVNRPAYGPRSRMMRYGMGGCSAGYCNPQYPDYSKEAYLQRLEQERRNLDLEIKEIKNQ